MNARSLPLSLVGLRLACAPAIAAAAWAGGSATLLTAILAVAFLSDVFDGIVARRLGVATPELRRADTLADTAFYLAATLAVFYRSPGVLARNAAWLAGLAALELARAGLERFKFGKLAAYHLWSSKAWGIALLLGFSEAFLTGRSGPLFKTALVLGIVSDLEGLAASLVLSQWRHDVPSLVHAVRLERSRAGDRSGTKARRS